MLPDPTKILIALTVLLLASTLYAIVLDRHPHWYVPDGTLYTVIVGDGLIFVALLALELWGVPLRAWIVLSALCTAGLPISVWQFVQRARNAGRRQGRGRDE